MFAACKEESTETGEFTQEYVDSAVNARVMELQVQMQASNDSVINALATWKADSMIAASKGQKPSTPKPRVNNPGSTTGGNTTTTPPPPPPSKDPTPTGKNNESQKDGEATGKNSDAQKQGEATGKRR